MVVKDWGKVFIDPGLWSGLESQGFEVLEMLEPVVCLSLWNLEQFEGLGYLTPVGCNTE